MANISVMSTYVRFFSLIVLSSVFVFCSNEEEPSATEYAVESKGTIFASFIKNAIILDPSIKGTLEGLGVDADDIRYNVDLYKLTYNTAYLDRTIKASAMIAVPKRDAQLSLVSVQHGTILANSEAPSEWTLASASLTGSFLEGLVDSMVGGHVSVNVDYLGFGASRDSFSVHPYLIRDSYPQDVMSAVRFTRRFARDKNINLNGQLFLRGYSEGAFATLAAQRAIEEVQALRNEFQISAVAVGAGPYDLLDTISRVLSVSSGRLNAPSYAPYIYLAAEQKYNWEKSRMASVFKTNIDGLRRLFNERATPRIQAEKNTTLLPSLIADLLEGAAITSLKNSTISDSEDIIFQEFKVSLRDNSLHSGWVPMAPTRLYHCDSDTTVPPENTTERAVDLVGGNNLTSTHDSSERGNSGYIIGTDTKYTHGACPLYALPIKEWFNKF